MAKPSYPDPAITGYTVGAPLFASVRTRISEIPERDWRHSSYRNGSQVVSFVWKPKTWKQTRQGLSATLITLGHIRFRQFGRQTA